MGTKSNDSLRAMFSGESIMSSILFFQQRNLAICQQINERPKDDLPNYPLTMIAGRTIQRVKSIETDGLYAVRVYAEADLTSPYS